MIQANFPLCSGTDRVAILQRDNDEIHYNSISRGEECILKKFVHRRPIERCENLEREHCEQEVRRQTVTQEDIAPKLS